VVSVTGNQFHRGSGYDEADTAAAQPTAQAWFDNSNDSISFAGNTDFVGHDKDNAYMRPDFDIEVTGGASGGSVTNFSYADSPTPQNAHTAPKTGVFGPHAMGQFGALLSPAVQ
jgi:hypothetical protein